ncbi:hypothetical protein BC827DRAFT_1266761 [Russula dissimulans]|nr:hypothetical protein BC827DRAFT_1266761 [Russula dissimulans]
MARVSPTSSMRRLPPLSFSFPRSHSSKRNSDAFRPKFPADPYIDLAFFQRDPVVLTSERLYLAAASQPPRDVILVLGGQSSFFSPLYFPAFLPPPILKCFNTEPATPDLAPLLDAERLAFSLVIIATHQPPPIPPKVQPVIRILRLAMPLATGQAGAIHLVNVLEWAERVARTWRKLGGIGVREFDESDQEGFGALVPPQNIPRQRSESSPSPTPSTSRRNSFAPSLSTLSSLDKLLMRGKRDNRPDQVLPSPDPSQRPFDALVNYLPSDISDKALLKYSILVTTVSRPFLVAAAPPSSAQQRTSKQGSFFMRKSIYQMPHAPTGSVDSLNSLATVSQFPRALPTKAHLVHLLPLRSRSKAASRLLPSIETFLLSFLSPPTLETKKADAMEAACPYFLESTAFTQVVGTPPCLNVNWTVADVLLSGCLDDQPMLRAWFSGASDIVVAAVPPSHAEPAFPCPAHLRSSRSPCTVPPRSKSSPLINMLPTPPDSEDASSRHGLPFKTARDKRLWGWKLWKRRLMAAPTPSSSRD